MGGKRRGKETPKSAYYAIIAVVLLLGLALLIAAKQGWPGNGITTGAITSLCQDDCTLAYDSLCHSECNGVNGCSFFDDNSRNVCDRRGLDFRLGYNYTYEVQCCEGEPYMPLKEKATKFVNASNWVTITKSLWYEGKLVKLVVDIFE